MGTMIDIDGIDVYRAEPTGPLRGGLIVIEEIWGLVPHIRAVADRFAAEGYLVLAPELLHDLLGSANGQELMTARNDPDEAKRTAVQPALRELFTGMNDPAFAERTVAHLRALTDVLAAEPGVDGRIGVTGFCFGGTYAFALAAADDRIRAAVPFYGSAPAPADAARIACPVLALYGAHDERLMAALPEVREAFADQDLTVQVYPDAGHAFFNDTNPHAYRPDDAADAWRRATAFLGEHLPAH
ncbi:dienelactone hydrolase family protein [Amnibacterium sp.]|uniref:dienelactone hydrolase family protein n=1 Tax=Amnibacterium sp. TaxID=1872496 RepID=UPI003F7C641C